MKIDRKATIADRPVRKVRDLLKRGQNGSFSRELVVEFLGEPDATDALLADGLIELDHSDDGKVWFKPTDKGIRLASTNLVPRITRAKAETIMAGFMRRVAEVNDNSDLITRVAEVHVFGSFITDAREVGDIDLAVVLERKLPGNEWVKRSRQRANATGRQFNFIAWTIYGDTEVMRILRGRNPYLTFTDLSNLEQLGCPRKRIFPTDG